MTIPACLEFDKAARRRKREEAAMLASLVRGAFHADSDGFTKILEPLRDEPSADPDTMDFSDDDDWDDEDEAPPPPTIALER